VPGDWRGGEPDESQGIGEAESQESGGMGSQGIGEVGSRTGARGLERRRVEIEGRKRVTVLTVYFGTPNMFITLWFGFDYETNPPLGTLII
jgi:hypothetical protein